MPRSWLFDQRPIEENDALTPGHCLHLRSDTGPVLPTSTSHARPTRVLVIDNERVGVANALGG